MTPLRFVSSLILLTSSIAGAASCSDTNRLPRASIPDTVPVECTVSDIMVPSCGAWLGASTPSADGTFDYTVGLQEYMAVAQNEPDILHFYKRDAEPFPTADEIALTKRTQGGRSLLFYNWKPSTDLTWRQVADGAADQNIDQVAATIAEFPRRLFLAIYHEPENDEGAAGSGMTGADYVDMYRYVVGKLRAQGAANAVFVMNYMGFSTWASAVDRFYPGDDVVDWVAYDPYGLKEHTSFEALLNDPDPDQDWPGFYEWVTDKAPGKPVMVAEWGFDLANQSEAATALATAAVALRYQFPMIKAMVYWNDSGPGGLQVRLDQESELGDAYGKAYALFANDEYFDMTPTRLAP